MRMRKLGEWVLRGGVRVLSAIPLVGPMLFFRGRHIKTVKEAFFLWGVSSSPVIFGILASERVSGGETLIEKVMSSLTLSEIFIYSSSFLSPVIYIAIEEIKQKNNESDTYKKRMRICPGYYYVIASAIIVALISAFGYGMFISNNVAFRSSWFYYTFSPYAIWIYVFAIYLWYLSLLDKNVPDDMRYDKIHRASEANAVADFEARMAGDR